MDRVWGLRQGVGMRSPSSPLAGRILWGLLIGVVAGVATLGLGRVWPDFLAGAKTVSTQVFGVPLGLGQQMTLLVLSVLSAVAVAGIPGGSLPLIAGLLTSFGVPAEGIGFVIGVDRLLDMTRAVVNVEVDLVTAAVVDARMTRAEGTGWRLIWPRVRHPTAWPIAWAIGSP